MHISTNKFIQISCLMLALSYGSIAQADWATLDSDTSSISLVSVKLKDFAEVHTFESFNGSISEAGEVQININAASIKTGIDIRDERMKEHLFAVETYPAILISAQVDLDAINHGAQRMQLPAVLSFLGKQHNIEIDVLVTKHKTEIAVSSATPLLVSAGQMGVTEAVAKLAELAGGITIGNSVPVNFALSFKR